MTPHRWLLLPSLLAACVGMVLGCSGGTAEKTIPYEVLKKAQRADGKLIIEVLVSEAASKQHVLNLAESLRRKYAGKYAFINIFDSRETWQRRDDESYPQTEFERHWLVQIGGAFPSDDPQKIHWLAKGRHH